MQNAQVIALLLPDATTEMWTGPNSLQRAATALVREADGKMAIRTFSSEAAIAAQMLSTGCFRPGKPIVDPVTREVMGYEMESIS